MVPRRLHDRQRRDAATTWFTPFRCALGHRGSDSRDRSSDARRSHRTRSSRITLAARRSPVPRGRTQHDQESPPQCRRLLPTRHPRRRRAQRITAARPLHTRRSRVAGRIGRARIVRLPRPSGLGGSSRHLRHAGACRWGRANAAARDGDCGEHSIGRRRGARALAGC